MIYKKLFGTTTNYKRLAWIEDLHTDISEVEWEKACLQTQTISINIRYKLTQYKWLIRTYITPERLNIFNPNIPDTFIKCGTERGTWYHCTIYKYEDTCKNFGNLERIINIVLNIINKYIPLCPKICILGLIPDTLFLRTHEIILVNICLRHAKRLIARHWKNIHCPPLNSWITEPSFCMAVESFPYIIKRKMNIFQKIWDSILIFLESKPVNS